METYWQNNPGIIGNYVTFKSFQEKGKDTDVRVAAEKFIHKNNFKNLLDLGCNTGIMFFRLRNSGWKGDYVGVDSNQKALDWAKNLHKPYKGFQFINHNIEDISSIEDNSFELVYSKDVIEHLSYYEGTLSEAFRITQKFILLSTFIHFGKDDKIYKHKQGYYLNSYDELKFNYFCNDNGFTVQQLFKDETYGLLLLEKI